MTMRKQLYTIIAMQEKMIKELNNLIRCKVDTIVPLIEELDQNKVYICTVNEQLSGESITRLKEIFTRACRQIKWNTPIIIFTNNKMQPMSDEEINHLIKYQKKQRS